MPRKQRETSLFNPSVIEKETDEHGYKHANVTYEGHTYEAIYLADLARISPVQGSYDVAPATGSDLLDITSPNTHPNQADQRTWAWPRDNGRPTILFQYEKKDHKDPTHNLELMKFHGFIVLDVLGYPIRHFEVLPNTVSSRTEGWRFEAWMRMDSRIRYRDLRARMVVEPRWEKQKDGTWTVLEDRRLKDNAINQRRGRDRVKARCICWDKGGDQKMADIVLKSDMSAQDLANNSTRGLKDTPKGGPQRYVVASYGSGLSRAGRNALSKEERDSRWQEVKMSTDENGQRIEPDLDEVNFEYRRYKLGDVKVLQRRPKSDEKVRSDSEKQSGPPASLLEHSVNFQVPIANQIQDLVGAVTTNRNQTFASLDDAIGASNPHENGLQMEVQGVQQWGNSVNDQHDLQYFNGMQTHNTFLDLPNSEQNVHTSLRDPLSMHGSHQDRGSASLGASQPYTLPNFVNRKRRHDSSEADGSFGEEDMQIGGSSRRAMIAGSSRAPYDRRAWEAALLNKRRRVHPEVDATTSYGQGRQPRSRDPHHVQTTGRNAYSTPSSQNQANQARSQKNAKASREKEAWRKSNHQHQLEVGSEELDQGIASTSAPSHNGNMHAAFEPEAEAFNGNGFHGPRAVHDAGIVGPDLTWDPPPPDAVDDANSDLIQAQYHQQSYLRYGSGMEYGADAPDFGGTNWGAVDSTDNQQAQHHHQPYFSHGSRAERGNVFEDGDANSGFVDFSYHPQPDSPHDSGAGHAANAPVYGSMDPSTGGPQKYQQSYLPFGSPNAVQPGQANLQQQIPPAYMVLYPASHISNFQQQVVNGDEEGLPSLFPLTSSDEEDTIPDGIVVSPPALLMNDKLLVTTQDQADFSQYETQFDRPEGMSSSEDVVRHEGLKLPPQSQSVFREGLGQADQSWSEWGLTQGQDELAGHLGNYRSGEEHIVSEGQVMKSPVSQGPEVSTSLFSGSDSNTPPVSVVPCAAQGDLMFSRTTGELATQNDLPKWSAFHQQIEAAGIESLLAHTNVAMAVSATDEQNQAIATSRDMSLLSTSGDRAPADTEFGAFLDNDGYEPRNHALIDSAWDDFVVDFDLLVDEDQFDR